MGPNFLPSLPGGIVVSGVHEDRISTCCVLVYSNGRPRADFVSVPPKRRNGRADMAPVCLGFDPQLSGLEQLFQRSRRGNLMGSRPM
jgi:hypothetical protein